MEKEIVSYAGETVTENEQIKTALERLYELRKDADFKLDELRDLIFTLKHNKLIDPQEKAQKIAEAKEGIAKAKALMKENRPEVKEIIKENNKIVREITKVNYVEATKTLKEKIVEIKALNKQNLADLANEYKHALSSITTTNKEERKLELANAKATHKSHLFEAKKEYQKRIADAKLERYQVQLDAYNTMYQLGDAKVPFGDKIIHKARSYVYNFKAKDFLLKNGLYIIILLTFIASFIAAPLMDKGNLLTIEHLSQILEQSSTQIFYALGVAGLILLAGTDLSIGRMVGMGALITSVILHAGPNILQFFGHDLGDFSSMPDASRVLLALVLTIVATTLFSCVAGFFTAKFKMHPFITTLSTQLIIYGIVFFGTGGLPVGQMDRDIKNVIASKFYIGNFPIYTISIYAIIAIAVVWFIWNKTKFGKNMYAVGGNQEAAAVSGISVFWTTMGVFIMAGILYGMGSFLEAFRSNASAGTGTGFELNAIAACVVGGISFSGGIGKIKGAVIGVLIFTGLTYVLSVLGIDTNLQFVLQGVIIMAAVALDSVKYLKKK